MYRDLEAFRNDLKYYYLDIFKFSKYFYANLS